MTEKRRPSARPLWKDICAQFGRYRPLLGSYVIILNNVAWGTHTSKTRKKLKEQPEQWIIALTNIAKLLGMDPRNAMRELKMLEYMGVIILGKNGEQNLIITSTNECKKSAEEAEQTFPKIKRTNSGHGHSSDGLRTRAMAIVQTNELGPRPNLNSGHGHSSNERTRATAHIRGVSSLYDKNIREEDIREEEREEEEPTLSQIKDSKFSPTKSTAADMIKTLSKSFGGVPIKKTIITQPLNQMKLGELWYRWAAQNNSEIKFTEMDYIKAIGKIQKILNCNDNELDMLLSFVVHKGFYATRFLYPDCYEQQLYGQKMVTVAFKEMKASK